MKTSSFTNTEAGFWAAFSIAGTYFGTIVGAGFATGQEVLQFFGFHGRAGLYGLMISTVLFVILGRIIMEIGRRVGAKSHADLIQAVTHPRTGRIIDGLITISLVGSLIVLIAGGGAVLEQQLGFPALVGSMLLAICAMFTVLGGFMGVVRAVSGIAPLLIIAVSAISVWAMRTAQISWDWADASRAVSASWLFAALLYVSHNLVLAVSILAPLGTLYDPVTVRWGAFWGGCALGIGGLALYLCLLTRVPTAAEYDVPILFIANQLSPRIPFYYSILLLLEIYTTAVTSLYGLAARLTHPGSPGFGAVTIIATFVAFCTSILGFSKLMGWIYPAMGYVGLLLIGSMLHWAYGGRKLSV
jgi:uncharacterized membrane protein YkvI